MGAGHAHGVSHAGPGRLRSVRLALAVSLVVFAAKLGVYFTTGLVVMLAEALHSLTDAMQTGFLLLAAHLSARPPDEEHPFGHGRGENLAAIMVSMVVVSLVAVELVREALGSLREPGPPPSEAALALAVLAGSALLMLWPLLLARRDMRHGGVVRAQAVESLNDLLGVLAAAAGVVLVMMGMPEADALAALAVAGIIVYNAVQLFRANLPHVVGGSPPRAFYEEVERVAKRVRGARGVHSMAAEYVGPTQVHLDLSLTVPDEMSVAEADRIASRVRRRLEEEMGLQHVSIHFCSAEGELQREAPGHRRREEPG